MPYRGPSTPTLVPGPGQPAPDPVGDALPKLEAPLAHRLMADDDAARGQDLVHVAQAQGEAEVEPHRVADDLGREAIAGVAGVVGAGGRRHLARLPDPIGPGKPVGHQLDDATKRPPAASWASF